MKIDTTMVLDNPADAGQLAKKLEAIGYSGVFSFEGQHDPFLPLAIASQTTQRVELGTGIAVAFARNPMNLAYLGHDLQQMTQGRFILGLGTQVQAHIEKRFGCTWSQPALRMREMILAIKAIWACWDTGDKLRFEGDFYRHTLMTPTFSPLRNDYGAPKIYAGGFGPKMTSAVAEVADGFIVHPFHTSESVRAITLPAIHAGLSAAQRPRSALALTVNLIVGAGDDAEALQDATEKVRKQIAFYASTPAYKPVLDVQGLGDLQPRLNALSKEGQWDAMSALIPDDLLNAVAVVCPRDEMAARIRQRCGGVFDRVNLVARYTGDDAGWADVVADLQKPLH